MRQSSSTSPMATLHVFAASLTRTVLISLLAICGFGACTSEPSSAAGTTGREIAVDPASNPASGTNRSLSNEERTLLLRARGRKWEQVSDEEISNYLSTSPDSIHVLYLWDPSSGVEGLKAIQRAADALAETGIRILVAAPAGGDFEDQLVDLRQSQIVLSTCRLPAEGKYPALPQGRLPDAGSLIVSEAAGMPLRVLAPTKDMNSWVAALIGEEVFE